jgi:hypothetical protein
MVHNKAIGISGEFFKQDGTLGAGNPDVELLMKNSFQLVSIFDLSLLICRCGDNTKLEITE